jgi:hypothetical protein
MADALTPDAVEAVRVFLGSRPSVTAIAGARIGVGLSSPEPSIRLSLTAGDYPLPGVGAPLVQVECWGRSGMDDGSASLLARTVVAEVSGMPDAAVDGYPFDSPDAATDRARQIVMVRALVRAAV